MEYIEHIMTTTDMESMKTATEGWKYGWKYGFIMVATLKSGETVVHDTGLLEHESFLESSLKVFELRDVVKTLFKDDVSGVLVLSQTMVRVSSVDTFKVTPIAYEPKE